jgi:Flp pilus assembly protein TadD
MKLRANNWLNLTCAWHKPDKAMSELENYVSYLESQNKNDVAILFIEEIIKDHADQPLLKRALAARLHHSHRTDEAIAILDTLGETLMQSGEKQSALEVINQIVLMNPPNAEEYRQLLIQMQNR